MEVDPFEPCTRSGAAEPEKKENTTREWDYLSNVLARWEVSYEEIKVNSKETPKSPDAGECNTWKLIPLSPVPGQLQNQRRRKIRQENGITYRMDLILCDSIVVGIRAGDTTEKLLEKSSTLTLDTTIECYVRKCDYY